MRALVTGGHGFIGRAIADLLRRDAWDVTVLDSLDPRVHGPSPPEVPPGVCEVRGDVRDTSALARALAAWPDVVFHEAAVTGLGRGALDVEDFVTTNVLGTARLLRAMATDHRPRPRLVLASSVAVYGEGAYECPACGEERRGGRRLEDLRAGRWEPPCPRCGGELRAVAIGEDRPFHPETFYARSKAIQEQTARELGAALGVVCVALRYHNVYGPAMPRNTPYAGVASLFKSRLLAGEPPVVLEDGLQRRDFIRVEEVARANLLAALAPEDSVRSQAYNIGTGIPCTVGEVARGLTEAMAPDLRPILPGSFRPGDPRHVIASTEKATRELGFAARIPLREGLQRFAGEAMRPAARGAATR